MKNGVGYITRTDGKLHFLMRQDRGSEPIMLSTLVASDEEALHAVLGFVQDNNLPLDKAVLAIDARDCFLRNYRLPIQGKRQLDQVVAFEIVDDLPVGPGELVVDHYRGCYANGVSHVSAAAIRKERIAELVALYRDQGVALEGIDVDVAAFARACANHFSEYDNCVGLEIGRDRTLFCAMAKGKVQHLAVIGWGESLLVDGFAEKHGLSAEEVDRIMVLDSGAGAAGDDMLDAFDDHLEQFLRKTLREVYRLLGDGDWPSQFVVSGEIVRVRRFRKVFEAVSESGVQIWEELCLKLGDEVDEGQRGSGLAVGYGAAESSGGGFNLLKDEFAPRDGASAWRREIVYAAMLLLAIGVAWGAYAYASLISGEREIEYLDAAILEVYKEALPDVAQELSPMQYESILSSRLGVLTGEKTEDGGVTVIETLRLISAALSREIDVEFLGLSLDNRLIDIQGEAKTMNEVDGVRVSLEKAKAFKGVKVKNAVTDKQSKRIRFEIEVLR